jgi:lysophospholipase L1-like esterase
MKAFLILLAIILLIAGYLGFNYSRINTHLTKQNQNSPFKEKQYPILGQGQSSIRYIAVGDDLSAGVGASDFKKTYSYKVAEKLGKQADIVTFINLSKPGATAEQAITQASQASLEKADIITVHLGLNDLHNFVNPSDFKKSYEKVLSRLATTRARIYLINIPYLGSPKLVGFPFNFALGLKTQQLNEIIESMAKQNGLFYINLHAETLDSLGQKTSYSPDLIHPSEDEYLRWAEVISKEIR